jgi:hypothetical protein
MSMTLTIRDKELSRQLRKATAKGLKMAAVFYHARVREAVNRPNTGTRRKRTRTTVAGKKGSQYTTYDQPSKAGEPPRKRTGHGQSQIVWEFNGDQQSPAARVGVKENGLYMAYLELGTRHIAPRPWLSAILQRYKAMIGRLAATGGSGEVGR